MGLMPCMVVIGQSGSPVMLERVLEKGTKTL